MSRVSRRLCRFVPATAVVVLLSGQAALAADAANGERLAQRWCASCHVIAADQRTANADAPTFSAIARRPDFSAEKIAAFLRDPHPKMPSMDLSRTETADLAAYIATQRE